MPMLSLRARAHKARARLTGVVALAALFAFAIPQVAGASTTVVRSNAMTGWTLENQDLATGNGAPTGRFVSGPSVAPAGFGSFRQAANSGDKTAIVTVLHNGDALADINALSYSTYSTDTDPTVLTPVMKIAVDKDGNGSSDTTLVFEPYEQAQYGSGPATATNTWQTWNGLTGKWWSTNDGGVNGARKTFAEWRTQFGASAAVATVSAGGVRIESGATGSAWPNFVGYTDKLVIGSAVYDFEPTIVTEDAMQGWLFEHQDLNAANGAPVAAFVNGPAVPASGYGSLKQTVLQGDKSALITANHNGLALSALDALSYSTYVSTSTAPVYPAAMKLAVDKDANGTADTTLVFEPAEQVSYGGTAVAANTWQTWDALNGSWWSTAAADGGNAGPRQTLGAWATAWAGSPAIATVTPAGVRIETGATGTSWPNHVGNIDNVAVGIASYDFETLVPDAPVITQPAHNGAVNSTNVTLSGTANPRALVEITKGTAVVATAEANPSGAWTTSATFAAGTHTLRTTATDPAGNESPQSAAHTFTVDLVAPGAPIISAPAAGAVLNSASVSFSGYSEPNNTITLKEGAIAFANATANGSGVWSATATMSDGVHNVTATAADAAGNAGGTSAVRSFTVDSGAPAAPSISTPLPGAALKNASVSIAGTAPAGSTVTVSEGTLTIGTATAAQNGAWSVSGTFTDGVHTVSAVATVGTSTSAPVARSFTVDTLAPNAPVLLTPDQGARFATRTVSVSGTADPNEFVHVREGSQTRGATRANNTGAWSVNVTLSDGAHTLVAVARDAAGNESAASASRTITVDTLKPTVSFTTANRSFFLQEQVKIEGAATDAQGIDTVKVAFVNAVTGEVVTTVDATLTVAGSRVLWVAEPAALPAGAYTVRATATDLHGNTGTASITIVNIA